MTDKTYLLKADEDWDWRDLRDFVEDSYKSLPNNYACFPERESAIFKAFLRRYPDGKAVQIARYACKTLNGIWLGYAVTPISFRRDNDDKFANPILQLLGE